MLAIRPTTTTALGRSAFESCPGERAVNPWKHLFVRLAGEDESGAAALPALREILRAARHPRRRWRRPPRSASPVCQLSRPSGARRYGLVCHCVVRRRVEPTRAVAPPVIVAAAPVRLSQRRRRRRRQRGRSWIPGREDRRGASYRRRYTSRPRAVQEGGSLNPNDGDALNNLGHCLHVRRRSCGDSAPSKSLFNFTLSVGVSIQSRTRTRESRDWSQAADDYARRATCFLMTT